MMSKSKYIPIPITNMDKIINQISDYHLISRADCEKLMILAIEWYIKNPDKNYKK